jgi:RNA polymerase sigma-70 factor (ECF subfamily)
MYADEILWVKRARQGDESAFSQLVEAYQRPVFNLCYRRLGDAAEAQVLVLDAGDCLALLH